MDTNNIAIAMIVGEHMRSIQTETQTMPYYLSRPRIARRLLPYDERICHPCQFNSRNRSVAKTAEHWREKVCKSWSMQDKDGNILAHEHITIKEKSKTIFVFLKLYTNEQFVVSALVNSIQKKIEMGKKLGYTHIAIIPEDEMTRNICADIGLSAGEWNQ